MILWISEQYTAEYYAQLLEIKNQHNIMPLLAIIVLVLLILSIVIIIIRKIHIKVNLKILDRITDFIGEHYFKLISIIFLVAMIEIIIGVIK